MEVEERKSPAVHPGVSAVVVAVIAALAHVIVEIHGSAQKTREIALLEKKQQLEVETLKAALRARENELRAKEDELRAARPADVRAAAKLQPPSARRDRRAATETQAIRLAVGGQAGSGDIYERPIRGETP